ncbi:DNA-binding MarR family transcriptional regulator [Microbacterium endophyticum]|uniref:DNA-binding MarR family transcriptional regulator n=1 Tax=Microbacterium endophyticum TaxID=1526412 RepID=A0A7W4YM75_9MICO|nr:MarR family transcriptional regulator [Microbacterium endophyticum]MBB2975908.1 DNA-binding MarR family transcriptional regulator [Microbacterium endophyticum]NIK36391.1 DNA-binding MarR family transcriptional regulator [Microbacterium endophyticum]
MASNDDDLAELAETILRIGREIEPRGSHVPGVVSLTGTEITALRWIQRHPHGTPSAIAEGTGLRRSNLSVALRGLESHGLVVRRHDDEDSRLVRIELTDLAHETSAKIREYLAQRMRAALAGSNEDLGAAKRFIERVAEGL